MKRLSGDWQTRARKVCVAPPLGRRGRCRVSARVTNIRFHVLGVPRIVAGNQEHPTPPSRPLQLLAYLAVQGSWQNRDALARLFWPDRQNKAARSNLRNLLCKTEAAAPGLSIESTEQALRLLVPGDLADFEAALERGHWQAAVDIGRHDLLQGFEAVATEPYLDWLASAREALLAKWKRAVQAGLAETALPVAQREALATAWALRCPLDEDVVRVRLMQALSRQQPATAMQIYREFEEKLRVEYAVQPSRDLVQWVTEAQAAHRPKHPLVTNTQAAMPLPAGEAEVAANRARTAMVGRRAELAQLGSLLEDESVRLITVTGPGGIGKSTLLAALAAQCLARGLQAVRLVDASAAGGAQAVVGAMAVALGIDSPQGPGNDWAMAEALRDQACLLLLDGAEQPGLQAPLASLLARCSGLRLVVASRRRLALEPEHVVSLDGFPLPDADEVEPELLASYDAVRYMAQQMQLAGQPLQLLRDGHTLVALVRAVDGLPLAMRLLAQLTPLFSLQQLLDNVRHHMAGQPAEGAAEIAELMPALLASFDRSWQVLSPLQQEVLARLAVFQADFDVEAARAVANTAWPVITSLVDCSMVRGLGDGRLALHAAIRSCVQAVCAMPPAAGAAHAAHYTLRLQSLAALARHTSIRPLLSFVRAETVNICQAWRWAVRHRAMPTLLAMAESLWFVGDGLSDWVTGLLNFEEVELALRDDPAAPSALLALLLGWLARSTFSQGQVELAAKQARSALRLAQRAGHRDALGLSLDTLMRTHLVMGHKTQAQALMQRSAALQRQHGEDGLLTPLLLRQQGMLYFTQSDWAGCKQINQQVTAIYRRLDDSNNIVRMLLSQAFSELNAGRLQASIDVLTQAIEAAASPDVSPSTRIIARSEAACVHVMLEQFDRARIRIEEIVAIASRQPISRYAQICLWDAIATEAVTTGKLAQAKPALMELMKAHSKGEKLANAEGNLLLAALWFRQAGSLQACVDLLRTIGAKPFSMQIFEQAQSVLRELGEPALPGEATAQPSEAEVMQAAADALRRMQDTDMPRAALD